MPKSKHRKGFKAKANKLKSTQLAQKKQDAHNLKRRVNKIMLEEEQRKQLAKKAQRDTQLSVLNDAEDNKTMTSKLLEP